MATPPEISRAPGSDHPGDLLERARARADRGEIDAAARDVRAALTARPRYAVFPRVQPLVERLNRDSADHARTCRIAVLGTRTTSLLIPVLQACCFRDRVRTECYQGLYGAIEQEVLDPGSGLHAFRPDIVFLVWHWRDLNLSPVAAGDPREAIDRIVGARRDLWSCLGERLGCHVVQFNVDAPAMEPYGYLASSLPGGRQRVIDGVNAALLQNVPPHVSILDAAAVQREAGADHWHHPLLWFNFQQHPSTDALPALADLMSAHVRAVLGLTRKVLVTDLDNTLWKGVIGEDGLTGIEVGPGSPAGEAHQQLQEYLLDLKARGVLLAVCSKNNPEDARLPFEKHAGMKLRLDDFAAFRANWDDKARNLSAIAAELSLGLDSFVFLDDNPMERDWVRSQHPSVAVVDLGTSVFQYVQALDRGRYFFTLTLSGEDLARADQYRREAARRELQSSSGSLDEFLAQLQMEASDVPIVDHLARVTQLINKTNQFNLTTRRYTEGQVELLASAPAGWARAFRLADRLGDYGLIGVLICRPRDEAADREPAPARARGTAGGQAPGWVIDTWLMSCRVLGRQMERFMFDRLVEAAQARGIRVIEGVYRPTAKNGLAAGLFEQLGFRRFSRDAESTRFVLDVPSGPVRTADHIRRTDTPPGRASEGAVA